MPRKKVVTRIPNQKFATINDVCDKNAVLNQLLILGEKHESWPVIAFYDSLTSGYRIMEINRNRFIPAIMTFKNIYELLVYMFEVEHFSVSSFDNINEMIKYINDNYNKKEPNKKEPN